MKKAGIFWLSVLTLTAVTAFSACSQQTSAPDAGSSADNSIVAAVSDVSDIMADKLAFVNNGEVYFDVQLKAAPASSVRIMSDGKALDGKTASLGTETTLVFADDDDPESMNVIVVVQRGDTVSGLSIKFAGGIDKERISDYITRSLSGTDVRKAYVAVMEKGAEWDHTLSEALNQYITDSTNGMTSGNA